MGCWNGTCGLTQLHINAGDPVVAFILEEQSSFGGGLGGGYCYSNDYWTPAFVPLYGNYDDYGSVEDIEPGSEILLDYFNNDSRIILTEDKYEKNATPQNIEEFMELLERGRYSYKPTSFGDYKDHSQHRFSMVMFHRPLFETVCNEMADRKPYGQDQTLRELLTARIDRVVDKRLAPMTDDMIIKFMFDRWPFDDYKQGISNRVIYERMLDEIKAGKIDAQVLKNHIFTWTCISYVMSYMRKGWAPQSGAGSQSQDNKLYKVLADASVKLIEDKYNKWNTENYEPCDPCEKCGDCDEEGPWSTEYLSWWDRDDS